MLLYDELHGDTRKTMPYFFRRYPVVLLSTDESINSFTHTHTLSLSLSLCLSLSLLLTLSQIKFTNALSCSFNPHPTGVFGTARLVVC